MGVVAERALPTYPQRLPAGGDLHARARDRPRADLQPPRQRPRRDRASSAPSTCAPARSSSTPHRTPSCSSPRTSSGCLWRSCIARAPPPEAMSGEHAVGRVIARPFTGEVGAFKRTDGRRDFALAPSGRSYLQELQDAGVEVHGVGKIDDLFAGVGVDVAHPGATNARALAEARQAARLSAQRPRVREPDRDRPGVRPPQGRRTASPAHCVRSTRAWGRCSRELRHQDLLIVTADHGVDLTHPGTDHTREYAPLLAVTGEMLARGGRGAPSRRPAR